MNKWIKEPTYWCSKRATGARSQALPEKLKRLGLVTSFKERWVKEVEHISYCKIIHYKSLPIKSLKNWVKVGGYNSPAQANFLSVFITNLRTKRTNRTRFIFKTLRNSTELVIKFFLHVLPRESKHFRLGILCMTLKMNDQMSILYLLVVSFDIILALVSNFKH